MKVVSIRCEHVDTVIKLRIPEQRMCCIQCGLIQVVLSRAQADRVHRLCHCMPAKLHYEHEGDQSRAVMTIDPSQLDLGGKYINSWLIG
jgi:hypothetical protein